MIKLLRLGFLAVKKHILKLIVIQSMLKSGANQYQVINRE